MVLNDTMSAVLKFNKCETCQPKISDPLTIEKHVLVGNYFCKHMSLVDWILIPMTWYHLIQNTFSFLRTYLLKTVSTKKKKKKSTKNDNKCRHLPTTNN